jgi:hypothetical protein
MKIHWNDYHVELTQEAYLSGNKYTAHAKDAEGRLYFVVWTPCENHLELDADMACDWGKPDYVRVISD